MTKEILTDEQARNKLISGANKLVDAVKLTIGPKGKNVVLSKGATLTSCGLPTLNNALPERLNEVTRANAARTKHLLNILFPYFVSQIKKRGVASKHFAALPFQDQLLNFNAGFIPIFVE